MTGLHYPHDDLARQLTVVDRIRRYEDVLLDVHTPGSAAYTRVRPRTDASALVVHPRVPAESLIYAPLITHKIADAGTDLIAAADSDNLAKSKTLVDEILADCNAHIASETYHVAAGVAIVPGHLEPDTTNTVAAANMSNAATGYTLADELAADLDAHVADDTFHNAVSDLTFPGTPTTVPLLTTKVNAIRTAMIAHFTDEVAHVGEDIVNFALASATTIGSDEASTQTLINLLKAYWNSHCGCGAANSADLAAVCMVANAAQDALVAHMNDQLVAHGGLADSTHAGTLSVVVPADDQAKANTLLNAIKAQFNLHCAVVDGGNYATLAAGLPLDWACDQLLFVKTSAAGVFTVTEFSGR